MNRSLGIVTGSLHSQGKRLVTLFMLPHIKKKLYIDETNNRRSFMEEYICELRDLYRDRH